MQTALSLAVAEEACEFEHRDLHWGNLLVRRDSNKATACKLRYATLVPFDPDYVLVDTSKWNGDLDIRSLPDTCVILS